MAKFKALAADSAPLALAPVPAKKPARQRNRPEAATASTTRAGTTEIEIETLTRGTARKNDPGYIQVNGFIPRGLHKTLRKELVDMESDLSVWMEERAREWLESRGFTIKEKRPGE
jgi:hypothetical protein